MKKKEVYLVDADLAQRIVDYLQVKPYCEVADILNPMRQLQGPGPFADINIENNLPEKEDSRPTDNNFKERG